jgi:hypothetical protein
MRASQFQSFIVLLLDRSPIGLSFIRIPLLSLLVYLYQAHNPCISTPGLSNLKVIKG